MKSKHAPRFFYYAGQSNARAETLAMEALHVVFHHVMFAIVVALTFGAPARVSAQAPRQAAYVLRGPGLDQEVVQLVVRTALQAGRTQVLEPSTVSAAMAFLPLAPGAQIDDAYATQLLTRLGIDTLVIVETVANPDGSFAIQILTADRGGAPSRAYGAAENTAGLGTALSRLLGEDPGMAPSQALPAGPALHPSEYATTGVANSPPGVPATVQSVGSDGQPAAANGSRWPGFALFAALEFIPFSSIGSDHSLDKTWASMTFGVAPAAEYCFSSSSSICLGVGFNFRFPSFDGIGSLTEIDSNLRVAYRNGTDFRAGKLFGTYLVIELGYSSIGGGAVSEGGLRLGYSLGFKVQLQEMLALNVDLGEDASTTFSTTWVNYLNLHVGLEMDL